MATLTDGFRMLNVAFEEFLENLTSVQKWVHDEKARFGEREKELHSAVTRYKTKSCKKVALNIGGAKFHTSEETLLREDETFFWMMFREWKPDENGQYFIDRSPDVFGVILEYLRHNKTIKVADLNASDKEMLVHDLDFYGLRSFPRDELCLLCNSSAPPSPVPIPTFTFEPEWPQLIAKPPIQWAKGGRTRGTVKWLGTQTVCFVATHRLWQAQMEEPPLGRYGSGMLFQWSIKAEFNFTPACATTVHIQEDVVLNFATGVVTYNNHIDGTQNRVHFAQWGQQQTSRQVNFELDTATYNVTLHAVGLHQDACSLQLRPAPLELTAKSQIPGQFSLTGWEILVGQKRLSPVSL
eukprot:TRINITY_DN32973_c0_g1_i1.p1 TRINITY_DN32973_c0_g1~~TRINITY_DN32973_c0_g1_i1.p1  ORF type:complete len:353 (-),score=25.88 TRINITY_DN32973_c0_g1_i1:85-1143(-)